MVLLLVVAAIALALIVLIATNWAFVWTHVLQETGTTDSGSRAYNFWSGFGADLGYASIFVAVTSGVVTGIRRANCHVKGCWRIGKHPLEGTPYHLCAKHHPEVPSAGASHEQILEHHHRASLHRAAAQPTSHLVDAASSATPTGTGASTS